MAARKKTVNLTVDDDLLAEARALNINLSQTLSQSLAEIVRRKHAERWRDENKDILDAYNQHFEEHGCLSDEFRTF